MHDNVKCTMKFLQPPPKTLFTFVDLIKIEKYPAQWTKQALLVEAVAENIMLKVNCTIFHSQKAGEISEVFASDFSLFYGRCV